MATFIGTNGNDNLTGGRTDFRSSSAWGATTPSPRTRGFIPSELYGGSGNDTLKPELCRVRDGGTGNDNIGGSLGDDDLYGGSGDDQITNSGLPSDGNDFVDGGDGNDTIPSLAV